MWFGYSYLFHTRIWQALVPFLLLTLLLLRYNQEIMWTTEHLPLQRPNKSQLMTSYSQRSVSGRDRYAFVLILTFIHLWLPIQKSLPLFSANVPSLNKLISYENFTNCLEIWSEDSWNIKLYEGIPFFEIGKYLISKLDRKIAEQQTEISKNPRTMLKTNPCGRCWYPLFSKEHRLIGVFAPQSVYD